MQDMRFCQSCAMPLDKAEDHGTEKNGAPSADYCQYCYKDGAFVREQTMDQMIESCVPFVTEHYGSADKAREEMRTIFPRLKRWAK